MRRHAALLSTLLLLGLVAQVGWAKKNGPRCSKRLCRDGIAACIASGEKRRACKRGVVKICKAVGPVLCLPPTTTTTIPPVPTTLDVSGLWALDAALSENICGLDTPPSLSGGRVGIEQTGSVLAGDFGENTLAGQFTAADAILFALGQFCSAANCCGTASLSVHGINGTPGHLVGNAVFAFSARCMGFTCTIRYDGTMMQGADPGGGGGGGGGGGPGPKR